MDIEIVNLKETSTLPEDYHCDCEFCNTFLGVLIRPNGEKYSRLERRAYYAKEELKHFAKTPLHIARWAVQNFTEPGDWVLDPTMGAGTTAVESLRLGRNVVGAEIQFIDVIEANVKQNNPHGCQFSIFHMDARNIGNKIKDMKFSLVVNNPPYSGDQQAPKGYNGRTPEYNDEFHNLAFDKEGPQYWADIKKIYQACVDSLLPGGHFVIGVKDMMRKKKPLLLHKNLCEILRDLGLEYRGMVLLPHYPTTLFMNTYEQFYGIKCPMYQTVNIFRKS